jgi:hypothetical protein
MAPFLVRHPVLLNNWMMAREEALARVRAQPLAQPQDVTALHLALQGFTANAAIWHSSHPIQIAKLAGLRADLDRIAGRLAGWPEAGTHPWNALWQWGETTLSHEGQEALLALLLEPHGDLIDGLGECMSADEVQSQRIDGAMTIAALRRSLQANYGWALAIDFTDPANTARFWYVSEEKLEPRLGERHLEPGADLEQPLCIARLVQALHAGLDGLDGAGSVAEFLMQQPEHRFALRRVQIMARRPFAEVRDNLIAADMLPIDLMRCKLAFFGASRFDPRSDKWVRISLFQDMPYPEDFNVQIAQ